MQAFYILHKIFSCVDYFFDPFLSKASQHLLLQKNDLNSKCYATVNRSFHMSMHHISEYVWIRKYVFVLYEYIYKQDIRFNLIKQFCYIFQTFMFVIKTRKVCNNIFIIFLIYRNILFIPLCYPEILYIFFHLR